MVCMEIPLSEGSYNIETSQLRRFTNQSAGWFLYGIGFSFWFFQTDLNYIFIMQIPQYQCYNIVIIITLYSAIYLLFC